MSKLLKFKRLFAIVCVLLIVPFSGCKTNEADILPTSSDNQSISATCVDADLNYEIGQGTPVSYFLADINFLDVAETVDMLHKAEVDIITVPLSWCFLEPEEGLWETDVYSGILDRFEKEGFSFIFIIDAGNRRIYDETGTLVDYSIPDWVYEKAGFDVMLDFSGAKIHLGSMQYVSDATQRYYLDYCQKVIDSFGTRYSNSTVGFAPGIMSEFEIKYPQINFAWNDYSQEALAKFKEYLSSEYSTIAAMNLRLGTGYRSFEEITFPVINYNNSFVSGTLDDHPLYVDFQNFRSFALEEFLAPVYELIRSNGFATVSYFAQVLHPHDGIYNSGIVTSLASYVDIAVIDYNFYDGYGLVFDTVLPAMMTNYLKSAGYRTVWSGVYLERMDFRDYYREIQETITFCGQSGVCDGLEIGGVIGTLNQDPNAQIPHFAIDLQQRSEPAKVAIYASEWNFYHSHGESPDYINYFTDSISQMYQIVQFELGIDVDVISDGVILSDKIAQYDLIIAPAAFFVDTEVKDAVNAYVMNGGSLLQDFRFGEWDAYCNNTGDWLDELYSLSNREALAVTSDVLSPKNKDMLPLGNIHIGSCYPMIANVYSMAASDSTSYLFENQDGKMVGLLSENSICLGFQPQIQYKFASNEENRQQYIQVVEWAIDTLLYGS